MIFMGEILQGSGIRIKGITTNFTSKLYEIVEFWINGVLVIQRVCYSNTIPTS